MLEPMVLECGHTFCLCCISRIKKNVLNRHCPDCRKGIHYSTILHCNFIVKQVVAKLQGKCNLCQAEGLIGQLMTHACPEEEMSCTNEGCTQKVKRKEKEVHKKECHHRKNKCTGCKKEILAKNMEEHSELCCPYGDMYCPLGCEECIKRNELHLHTERCTKRRNNCSISGCHFWGNKEEKIAHDVEHACQHVKLLLRSEEKLKESLLDKKTDLLFLRKENIASLLWEIRDFKRIVAGFGGNTRREPLTSPNIDAHGCKWRLILQIAEKCSLYLQLVSAATTMHVGIRFVIEASDELKDTVFTVEPIHLKEGQMYGSEIHLSALETIAEGTKDLRVKVIIETVQYEMTNIQYDDN